MDMLREVAPFLIGLIVPPMAMLAIRASWSGTLKFAVALAPTLVLGICTSLFAGELADGLFPDGWIAIMIDTSLVFTGSQLAYRFFWKPALEPRLQRGVPIAEQRARR
jgi:hypothetical protein